MMATRRGAALVAALLLGTACQPAGVPAPAPGERPRDEAAREEPPAERGPVAIAVVVPQGGADYLAEVSELVLQGVRLAVEEHASRPGVRPVELVILDDRGSPAEAPAVAAELDRTDAIGVVGPLLSPVVSALARARRDSQLALVSPLAADLPPGAPNVYSLNAGDTRGAELLAEHAVALGLRRIAVLHSRSATYAGQAAAFMRAAQEAGGGIAVVVPYDSGTTTFAEPIGRIAAQAPQALFVAAPERDVRQIAPQIAYPPYGLDTLNVQVLGGEAWTGEDLRRLVAPRYLEGVIAATPLHRPSPEVAWREFVDAYERTYRRTLDNPYPALAYDAAKLLLEALPERGGRAALAERLRGLEGVRGATGRLSVRDGAIVRRPFLVRIRAGELVPVSASALPARE